MTLMQKITRYLKLTAVWKLSCALTMIFCLSCSSEKDRLLQLKGKLVNADSKSILLIKPNQDMRFDSIIEIPVKDGKFQYSAKLEHPEAVTLFLGEARENAGGRLMPLFLENENIDLTIYSEEEFDKNIVEGGKLNAEYKKYKENVEARFNPSLIPLQDSLNVLFENDRYNSEPMKALYTELRAAENQDERVVIYKKIEDLRKAGQHLSPEAEIVENKLKPIYDERKKFEQEYIEENPNIVAFYFLLNDLIFNREQIDLDAARENLRILSEANPGHPYNKLASGLLYGLENNKVGKKFTDFSAPDLEGNEVKLSEEIQGKLALLDLWATWCGPCIAKSRTMVPVYEEYKEKGFTIIGVAGEFENTDRLVSFLDKEKWPWQNLVELDRRNSIWQKYGVDGGGGGMFLIDEEGLILAKDPTAEEVRRELETRL